MGPFIYFHLYKLDISTILFRCLSRRRPNFLNWQRPASLILNIVRAGEQILLSRQNPNRRPTVVEHVHVRIRMSWRLAEISRAASRVEGEKQIRNRGGRDLFKSCIAE